MIEEIRRLNGEENSKKTLVDYNLTVKEAIQLLKNNNLPIVLTNEDKYIIDRPREYEKNGLDSLILVHKTRYIPSGSVIKSPLDAKATHDNVTFYIEGKKYEYDFKRKRNTVHFAVNGEVSSHEFGEWDDCKYAVLIPFSDVPREQIKDGSPVDTYTDGSVKLTSNSWILCPKGEGERLKELNPEVQVLEYEGENVQNYASTFLTALGYRNEKIGKYQWLDDESELQYVNLMDREKIARGLHMGSMEAIRDDNREVIEVISNMVRLIRKNTFLDSEEKINNLINEFNSSNESMIRFSAMIETVIVQYDSLFPRLLTRLEQEGVSIPKEYIELLNRMQEASKYKLDKENILPQDVSKVKASKDDDLFPDINIDSITRDELDKIKKDYWGNESIKDVQIKVLERAILKGISREQTLNAPEFRKIKDNSDLYAVGKNGFEKQKLIAILDKLEDWYLPKPPPPPSEEFFKNMPPPPLPSEEFFKNMPPPPPMPPSGMINTSQTEKDEDNQKDEKNNDFRNEKLLPLTRIQLMKKFLQESKNGKGFENEAKTVIRHAKNMLHDDLFYDFMKDRKIETYWGYSEDLEKEINGFGAIINVITKLDRNGMIPLTTIKELTSEEKLTDINATIHSVREYFRDSKENEFKR